MGSHRRSLLAAGAAALIGTATIGGVAVARGTDARLSADLDGQAELPPADPDGDGRARVTANIMTGEICFDVRIDDTGTPNRGHIHVGDSTVNGAIVVPLFELVGQPADARNDDLEEGRLEDCVDADPNLVKAIAADPEGYYVNLHNARFPAGAIRGQLED